MAQIIKYDFSVIQNIYINCSKEYALLFVYVTLFKKSYIKVF